MEYPQSFEELVECFKMLPGIGTKGAERLVYHVLSMDLQQVERFSDALLNLKKRIHYCKKCGHICEGEICDICQDPTRDQTTICVVESPKDVFAMEKLKEEQISKVSLIAFTENDIGNAFWNTIGWTERLDLNYYEFTLNEKNITAFNEQ